LETHDPTLDEVYRDRNALAQLALVLALRCGLHGGIGTDPAEPDWPVVYLDLPDGTARRQVSWHIPQAELVGGLPRYAGAWDGHDNAEKARRILSFLISPARLG
jgi:hypothetical protein